MNIFEFGSIVGSLFGTISGGWLGYSLMGWGGVVIGVPLGAVAGWFVPPMLIFAMFLVGIFRENGFTGVRELFRKGRGSVVGSVDPPPDSGA